MTRIKICGITNKDDAVKAAKLGAWALGFIFYKKSPRYVSASRARNIIDCLPPFVTPVGVFVDLAERAVQDIAEFCSIKTLQFHGAETPQYLSRFKKYRVIKAFRVSDDFNPGVVKEYRNVSAFLFDTHSNAAKGGTGKIFNWRLIKECKDFNKPVILSGGLNAQNVKEALEEVKPFAVDVASGVEESPGKKSALLMEGFINVVNSRGLINQTPT